jgi:hypothetical protein
MLASRLRGNDEVSSFLFDDQPLALLRGEILVMPPEREPDAWYFPLVGLACKADYL